MKKIIIGAVLTLTIFNLDAQEIKSFKEKNEWGYKGKNGKVIVKPKYSYAWDFTEGFGSVMNKQKKYGFIDSTGKEVIPPRFDHAQRFKEDVAVVRMGGKYGLIDKTGKEIIPFIYEEFNSFNEGLAAVKLNGKYGFIDKTGKEIIQFKYSDAEMFNEGLAAVKLNDRYGYIDKTGKEIIPFLYTDAENFREGLAAVKLFGKYGYIDKTNKLVINHQYEYAGDFYDGEARVKINDKYIYIDKTGKNDEIRKQEEKEKAEMEKQKQQLAKELEKKDTLASEIYKIYVQHFNSLFTKVNALNNYLKSSIQQNAKGEFTNYQLWGVISANMKDEYCKNASQELNNYKGAMNNIVLSAGKNELYDRVNGYLDNVQKYISSCNGWAEFIKDKTAAFDAPAVGRQLEYIEKPLQAMARDERAIRSFIDIYKKRNGL